MAEQSSEASVQMRVVWKWFEEWDTAQRREFLERLVPLVTPNKLFALAQKLAVSVVVDSATCSTIPNQCHSFQDKWAFFNRLLSKWTEKEANVFLNGLEDIDYTAMCRFYDHLASTAQEP